MLSATSSPALDTSCATPHPLRAEFLPSTPPSHAVCRFAALPRRAVRPCPAPGPLRARAPAAAALRGRGGPGRGGAARGGGGRGPRGAAAPPGGAGRGGACAAGGRGAERSGMAGALTDVLGEVLVAADGEEVAVSALAARGVSLVGLYFGCSLGGPCAQLGASLAAFYGRFRGEAAAAGGQRLEIVFVSAEQEQQQWQEAVRAMPWLALPFADKHRKVRPAAAAGRGARPGLCSGAAGLGPGWAPPRK